LTEQIAAIQTELDLLKDDVDDAVDIQIINGGGPTA
jgi:hypothetical protein